MLKKIQVLLSPNFHLKYDHLEIVDILKQYRQNIEENFRLESMLLFENALAKIKRTFGASEGAEMLDIPSFFETSFLEERFSLDPSQYGIAVALALKSKKLGSYERARQLLERVASSGYREQKIAKQHLQTLFKDQ